MFGSKLHRAFDLIIIKKKSHIKPARADSHNTFMMEMGVVIYLYVFILKKKKKEEIKGDYI